MVLNIPPKEPGADDQPLRVIGVKGPDFYDFGSAYPHGSVEIRYALSRNESLFENAIVQEGEAFENYRLSSGALVFHGPLTEIPGNLQVVRDLVATIEDDGRNREQLALAKFNHLANRISEWNDEIKTTS